jgi:hypothetical protein
MAREFSWERKKGGRRDKKRKKKIIKNKRERVNLLFLVALEPGPQFSLGGL